jgi:hypothetical protein
MSYLHYAMQNMGQKFQNPIAILHIKCYDTREDIFVL